MKKAFVFFSIVIGFMFIAAPTAIERQYHQVFLNGKPFVKAAIINGLPAVQLQELALKGGANITLEPGFTLTGSTLNATISGFSTPAGSKVEKQDVGGIKQNPGDWHKADPAAKKAAIKGESRPMFKVNKPGPISTHVFNADGKMWVPLADIVAAFKGNLRPNAAAAGAILKQDEAFQLISTPNPDAILIGL